MRNYILTIAPLLCVWCCPRVSRAYSGGGPDSACGSLMPGHGVGLQRGAPPYSITASASQVSAGSEVTATIAGSKPFKGFFIRVKQGDSYVDGEFINNGGNRDRCSKTGVTHRNPQPKNSVTVVFRLGQGLKPEGGNLVFVAAIVEQKTLIWQTMSSEMVVVSNMSKPTQPGNTDPSMPTGANTQGGGGAAAANNNNDDDDDDDEDSDKDSGVVLQVGPILLLTAVVAGWAGWW